MKTTMTLILAVLLSLGFAVTSFATIKTTKHDLSSTGTSSLSAVGQNDEICIYCHSPHVEDITVVSDYNPLWNADVQISTSFAPYYSSTLDAAPIGDPLVGPSRLCMSCHDGTIAVDSALSTASGSIKVSGRFLVGNDLKLTSDHPIGFDYIAVGGSGVGAGAGSDLEIKGAGSPYAGSSTISAFLFGATPTVDGIMTCATCHDVHTDATDFFLVSSNDSSALCLACHDK